MPLLLANVLAGIGATGAFGVSLFFVLSSYLITELLLREKDLIGTLDVRSFYIRRILRIWPLYFAFLALAVILQWIVPGQHVTLRAGMWFSLLAGNWFIVFHGFPSSVIFPLWSVSIEEQFYITWPAIVRRATETGMLICARACCWSSRPLHACISACTTPERATSGATPSYSSIRLRLEYCWPCC